MNTQTQTPIMQAYIATDPQIKPQQVLARPMNSDEHAIHNGECQHISEIDDHCIDGYLVVIDEKHQAWYTADTFEYNYQPVVKDKQASGWVIPTSCVNNIFKVSSLLEVLLLTRYSHEEVDIDSVYHLVSIMQDLLDDLYAQW